MTRDGVEYYEPNKLHRTRYVFTSEVLQLLIGRESEIDLQES
jgi:hypothetical protein